MNKEDIPIFNLSKTELIPEDKEVVRAEANRAIENETEEMKRVLREISIPMNERVSMVADELHAFQTERCKSYGRNPPDKPEVFGVPIEYRARFSKSDSIGGFTNSIDNTVVVFTYPNELDMWIAKKIAHELEHAYAYHQNRADVNFEASEDDPQVIVGCYRRGGVTLSPKGEYGYFLEEGAAELGAIEYFTEHISKLFPDDYESYLKERSKFMEEQGLREATKDYLGPSYNRETQTVQMGATIYAYPVGVVKSLIDELPEGRELINQAHIRGNYVPLAREFEKLLGKGTFRVFMSLPIKEESIRGLGELFSAMNERERKTIMEKLLHSRPYDKETLRRRGVL